MTPDIRLICYRCKHAVRGPAPGVAGVFIHTGHINARLDATCGTWGYERDQVAAEGRKRSSTQEED